MKVLFFKQLEANQTPDRNGPAPHLPGGCARVPGGPVMSGLVNDVTGILSAMEEGDPHAAEQLLPLVYDELRRLAAARLAREKPGQTLPPTALVHEAYLRLVGRGPGGRWKDRTHFFRAAAEAMRHILVDQARRKHSQMRGGAGRRVNLGRLAATPPDGPEDLLALHKALDLLAAHDPVKAELVQLRYFGGLSLEETADLLGISRATADRYWRYARTWLYCALTRGTDPRTGQEKLAPS
jgi:RNA polymerase sigma factor (TIGR02999 family)